MAGSCRPTGETVFLLWGRNWVSVFHYINIRLQGCKQYTNNIVTYLLTRLQGQKLLHPILILLYKISFIITHTISESIEYYSPSTLISLSESLSFVSATQVATSVRYTHMRDKTHTNIAFVTLVIFVRRCKL